MGCVTPSLPVTRFAELISEPVLRLLVSHMTRLSIRNWSFLLIDYCVRRELDQRSSHGCELVFAFSCPQHTILSLLGQIVLFEKVSALALELDI